MTHPTPDAGQKWRQFEKTGQLQDYLAYRSAKDRRQPKGSAAPSDPLL